jgi:RimJ/RimL family protein N-acetyltransferase
LIIGYLVWTTLVHIQALRQKVKQDDLVMANEVHLRDVTENDIPVFFEQQLEPEANRMAAFPARDRESFMKHWARILNDENVYKKTILFNGRLAGNIVSFEQFGVRAVGYWLGKEYWSKGIATQALSAFLGHVKERPLYAYVAKHNIASRRVLEKCGFTLYSEDSLFSGASGDVVEEFILKLE